MVPFKNILVPVDLAQGDDASIGKALELCGPEAANIHLVHVARTLGMGSWQGLLKGRSTSGAEQALQALTANVAAQNTSCKVIGTLLPTAAGTTATLNGFIRTWGIDLLVAGRCGTDSYWPWGRQLNVYRVTRQTGCPVLSVTPGCLHHAIRSILLPVGAFIPEHKIQMALALARRFRAQIHLVVLSDMDPRYKQASTAAFYSTYKQLRECGQSPDYKVVNGLNTVADLYGYAKEVRADIVLINPEREAGLFKRLNRQLPQIVDPRSPLHILSLRPHYNQP